MTNKGFIIKVIILAVILAAFLIFCSVKASETITVSPVVSVFEDSLSAGGILAFSNNFGRLSDVKGDTNWCIFDSKWVAAYKEWAYSPDSGTTWTLIRSTAGTVNWGQCVTLRYFGGLHVVDVSLTAYECFWLVAQPADDATDLGVLRNINLTGTNILHLAVEGPSDEYAIYSLYLVGTNGIPWKHSSDNFVSVDATDTVDTPDGDTLWIQAGTKGDTAMFIAYLESDGFYYWIQNGTDFEGRSDSLIETHNDSRGEGYHSWTWAVVSDKIHLIYESPVVDTVGVGRLIDVYQDGSGGWDKDTVSYFRNLETNEWLQPMACVRGSRIYLFYAPDVGPDLANYGRGAYKIWNGSSWSADSVIFTGADTVTYGFSTPMNVDSSEMYIPIFWCDYKIDGATQYYSLHFNKLEFTVDVEPPVPPPSPSKHFKGRK